MKPLIPKRRNGALTLVEVLIVVAVMVVLAMIILPPGRDSGRVRRIQCVSNLKQIGLAFRIWEGDNNNQYPMAISVTNGGAMESIATGDVVRCFQVMSNQPVTPRILICPADIDHRFFATNFQNLQNSNISYFVSPDANETCPQMILSGDDNLEVNNVPVKPGLLLWPAHTPLSWTAARHGRMGNLAFADGSVSEVSNLGLQQALVLATNGTPMPSQRLVIP